VALHVRESAALVQDHAWRAEVVGYQPVKLRR
jgi:hypothetical protein